jgi:adenylate cyclase
MKIQNTIFSGFFSLFVFCFFLFTKIASAQSTLPKAVHDSLWAVWQDKSQPDTMRIKAIYNFAWDGYLFSQPDSAFYYAQLQYDFAKSKGLKKQVANALNLIGVSFSVRGNFIEALDNYQRSLKIEEEIGDQKRISTLLSNIGNTYDFQGDYPKALDYHLRSLKIVEKTGDRYGFAASMSNIGNIYAQLGEYSQSLDYHLQSLKIREEIEDINGIAVSLQNIGGVYREQDDNSIALDYFLRSLKFEEEAGDKQGIAISLNNIGVIYMDQGDYLKALDYYKRSLEIKKEIGDTYGIAGSLSNIGSLYLLQKDHSTAKEWCEKALELSLKNGTIESQQEAANCLYLAWKGMGNSFKALEYYELMIELRDSLFNEENTRKLTRLEMQYDFDKKEAVALAEQEKKDAIALQEMKRQKLVRNGFMGGFAAMLLFGGVVFVQRNRISKEKDRSESLLLNILPAETAQELKEKGSSDAVLINQVTVLFTDFKGFTAMSEILSPKELVADLHDCFSEFDRICEKYGIEKIKTIGDAYMAAGGLPSPNSTHAKDVVMAGLEMATFVEAGKANKIKQGLPFFEIRIGVHTGPVVAGIVGIKKFSYDIWGDTVNTASRMESSGEVGKVNISESTYELVKKEPQFAFESRGKIVAKGKGEIEMYFVTHKST